MLEELALPYELCAVSLNKAKQDPEYLSIHPHGKVPAIKIGQLIIIETLAICLYLVESNPEMRLAPRFESERAEYYKWMAYSTGTLEPAIIEKIRLHKTLESKTEYIDMGPVLTPFEDAISYINNTLKTRSFLLGEYFSAADIMIGSLFDWADQIATLTEFTHAKIWLKELKKRPAYQRSTA